MTQPLEREGSLSFSLAELSRLEGERQREQAERERRVRAARAEAESHAQRARRQREEQEARALEEQRLEEQRKAAEDAARLEAAHQAALVRAKTEAETEARAKLEELEHRHVEALARIRESEGVSDLKRVAMASWAFASVVCVAALVVVFAIVRPDAERRVAIAEGQAASQSEELRAAKAREQEGERRLRELGVKLDEPTRRASELSSALESARTATVAHLKAPKGPTAPAPPPPPPPSGPFGTNCPPGSMDPLCGLGK
jgi:colicin import membrane protein